MGPLSPGMPVGLDLGATGVRAARLETTRGGYRARRVASVDLPPGVIDAGLPADEDRLVRALKTLWRDGRFGSKRVCLGVPERDVITRQVDLPWMPPEDFSSALRYQVGDVLPVDVASVQLGYHVLDEFTQADSRGQPMEMNRTLVVAAPTDAVTAWADVVRKAGLEPVSADSSAFALIRAVCGGRLPSDGRARLVADIGADQITVAIHRDGQPRFLRTVTGLGGATATAAIATELGITLVEAEALKRETGLQGPAPTVAPVAESSVFGALALTEPSESPARAQDVVDVLNPWAASIVAEIRTSLDYFAASPSGSAVADVTLSGRTLLLDGLTQRIATQIPLPVVVADATCGVPGVGSTSDTRYVVALGLGMGPS